MTSKFGVVPTRAILDTSISNAQFRVFALICSYADKDTGGCYPSQNTLAEITGKSRQWINTTLKLLENAGWITSSRRFRDDGSERSKLYIINHDHMGGNDAELDRGCKAEVDRGCKAQVDTEHTTNEHTTNEYNNIPGNDFEIDSTENNLTTEEHEWDIDAFEIWWRAYPRLVNKKKAKIAYMSAMKKTDCATLLRGAEEYARQNRDTSEQYIKKPENWLNEEMWDDYQPKVKRYLVGGQVKEMSEELAKEIGATEI